MAFYEVSEGIRVVAEALAEKKEAEKVEEEAKNMTKEKSSNLADEEYFRLRRVFEDTYAADNDQAIFTAYYKLLQAFYKSHHTFNLQKDGLTKELVSLLLQQRFQNVHIADRTLHYHRETFEGQFFSAYLTQISRSLQFFMQKWIRWSNENEEALNKQVLEDMERPDFEATWRFVTMWVNNPS